MSSCARFNVKNTFLLLKHFKYTLHAYVSSLLIEVTVFSSFFIVDRILAYFLHLKDNGSYSVQHQHWIRDSQFVDTYDEYGDKDNPIATQSGKF
jgi:hypothetical protein